MIEFHMEFLERTFVPKDANYLFLRPGMVQLITYAEGKYIQQSLRVSFLLRKETIGDVMDLASVLPEGMDKYEAIFIPVNDGKPGI
jgi:sentrin-specific protease 8